MITIYTHSNSPVTKEFWRQILLRDILRKFRGPDAVHDSLLRGLREMHVPYAVNPTHPKGDAVLVLAGTAALKKALLLKKTGHIKTLIAGPNIVMAPHDADKIMQDPDIDIVLVPSAWVVDFWKHEAPVLASKIKIWPAGVAVSEPSTRNGSPIIYDKMGDKSLVAAVQQVLPEEAHVFTYGTFKQRDYLHALAEAPYLVYLSKSESQGLALQEAWAHDVPTLVNKSTHWESGMYSWDAPQINCPYLTPELGRIFEDSTELKDMIEEIKPLHPKEYCDAHLSDSASAEKLLEITRTMEKRT